MGRGQTDSRTGKLGASVRGWVCIREEQTPGPRGLDPCFLPVHIIRMNCECVHFTSLHLWAPSVIMDDGCGHTHCTDEEREARQRGRDGPSHTAKKQRR